MGDPMGKGFEVWARPLRDLRALSDKQIIELHDRLMTEKFANEPVGTSYYLAELQRREIHRQGARIAKLTWVIVGLTIANAAFVAISAFRNSNPAPWLGALRGPDRADVPVAVAATAAPRDSRALTTRGDDPRSTGTGRRQTACGSGGGVLDRP